MSVLVQLMAFVICALAAVMQLAVYRSPDFHDTYLTGMGRRISWVSMTVAAFYALSALLSEGTEPGGPFLVLILFGMSQLAFATSDLLPHLEKELPKWTSRLNNSP